MKIKPSYIVAALLAVGNVLSVYAQDQTDAVSEPLTVQALFEYPSAPENLDGLAAKSDWLVEHFWDSFNPGKIKSVDQAALNHAFSVYVVPMQWADKDRSVASVDRLISSLQKKPALLLQFTKAAEENLYGPRAMMYIDEIYVRFLEAVVKNKKLKDIHKNRYKFQLRQLKGSLEGETAPDFTFTKADGTQGFYTPTGNYTIIEFGDPTCYDCSMAKLKLDTDYGISELIKNGKVNICFIIPDIYDGWQDQVKDYPEKWVVGASDTVDEIYDVRLTPTFYIIGPDRKIKFKNLPVEEVIAKIKELNGNG